MNSAIEMELQNIRSALSRLEQFLKRNPGYVEVSSVQDDIEVLAAEVESVVADHTT